MQDDAVHAVLVVVVVVAAAAAAALLLRACCMVLYSSFLCAAAEAENAIVDAKELEGLGLSTGDSTMSLPPVRNPDFVYPASCACMLTTGDVCVPMYV